MFPFRGITIIVDGGSDTGTIDEPSRNGEAAAYIKIIYFQKLKQ